MDHIAVCVDLLNYRLQNIPLNPQLRFHLIARSFDIMRQVSMDPCHRHLGVYSIIEQLIMRQTLVTPPLDYAQIFYFILNNRNCKFFQFLTIFFIFRR